MSRENGYTHNQALFGEPIYGGKLTLQLFYANSTMCSDTDADSSRWVRISKNPESKNLESAFILMVDRGDCTFVSKARRAQHAGAAGVVIADNRCLCTDHSCHSVIACENQEPMMADDGSGADITIPVLMITKMDGESFKDQLIKSGNIMLVQMSWALPNPDDRVEWSLWTSPIDENTVTFTQDFLPISEKLGSRAYFEPHYMLSSGSSLNCEANENLCNSMCTNKGRYCFSDSNPDPTSSYGLLGSDVVKETLRRICIFKHYGSDFIGNFDSNIGLSWWRYVNLFHQRCGLEHFKDQECIAVVMHLVGIDAHVIDSCMDQSGGVTEDIENTLLQAELEEKDDFEVIVSPSVYVNTVIKRGSVSAPSVFSTICAGYAADTQPQVCACAAIQERGKMLACVSRDGNPEPSENRAVSIKNVSPAAFAGIVLSIILIMILASFIYWNRTQKQLKEQVQKILSEYMPLDDIDAETPEAGRSALRHQSEYF